MAKATHDGTCQKCGSLQKLPGGILAKHGYTTKWGFFSGTCNGSHELPFELSKGLIERFIEQANTEVTRLQELERELRQPVADNGTGIATAWLHELRAFGGGHTARKWVEVQIRTVEHHGENHVHYSPQYLDYKGQWHRYDLYGQSVTNAAQVATILNGKRASAVLATIVEMGEYVKWQRGRIEGWKPGKLKPVGGRK